MGRDPDLRRKAGLFRRRDSDATRRRRLPTSGSSASHAADSSLLKSWARVKLLLCDVDGVLTDGSVFIGGGAELKRFDIQDGLGMVALRQAAVKVGWISSRPSPATRQRADELKIDFLVQQKGSKVAAIERLLRETGSVWADVCYVGDDIVDVGALQRAGVAVAVANGVAETKAVADYITNARGGNGAVREVVELILKAQGKWAGVVAGYAA